MKPFVHLHVHTEYSLLDGATRIEPMLKKCNELKMPAVAVTDHGNMYCAWKFMQEAKKANIKPIVGCEFYLCENLHGTGVENKEYFHLILLAKNNDGYYNLCRLNSIAFVEGYYYKPRIDFETLKKYKDGLICLSACIAGQLPRLFLDDNPIGARELAMQYKELFGDDYYIELQNHGLREEKAVMQQLIDLAKELDIPMVVTNDIHYLDKEDAEQQDIMLCVQTGKFKDDPKRMRFQGEEYYLKNYDEMAELFPDYPEILENTVKIAEKCSINIDDKKFLPNYNPPDGSTPGEFLRKLVDEGLKEKYPEITPEITERVEYELSVITSMGFLEYYLIVWDFIHYAKSHGIPVGPGRGSGAGSVIAYLIGITEVEPFRYNLLFERFLNPERTTMPDFDVDFCMDRRGEVIDYVFEKYGEGNVSQIVTFGTMAAKNAIRDVARVLRVPVSEANRLAKMVPDNFKYSLKNLLGKEPYPKIEDTFVSQELLEACKNPETAKIIDLAMKLDGTPRQTGMHAAGVVICRDKISDHVPLQTNGGSVAKGGIVTTQYNMSEVEKAGLLKMDFLGLRTLTDIKKAIDYIYEDYGEKVDFSKSDYNDPEIFKLIGSGDTMCIFQLEGGGMTKLMIDMQPDGLEDVIAGISLYRPGPMQFIPNYIAGKRDRSTIRYSHPLMESILSPTYGCVVYQEQVMQIVRVLAGFTAGMADTVRYAMSKKNFDLMKKLGEQFVNGGVNDFGVAVPGCVKNGIPKETAQKIYDELIDFSQYAFNKAHAACYAYVAYQTAWLKRYYPTELLCAILNNRIGNIKDIKKYTTYAKSRQIDILPPDINKSYAEFHVENGALRFGLGGIKNVGMSVVEAIIKERDNGEFTDMANLFGRTFENLNKRMVENLIKGGAFDCFGRTRADMMQCYQAEMDEAAQSIKKRADGQVCIFDLIPDFGKQEPEAQAHGMKEYPQEILYSYEKEVLGMYMSGSPLDKYDEYAAKYNFDFNTLETVETVTENADGTTETIKPIVRKRVVAAGGILRDIRIVKGKENKYMGFGVLEDKFDSIEVALFSPAFERYRTLFAEDAFVIVKGALTDSRDAYKINIREIINPKSDGEMQTVSAVAKEDRTVLCLNMPVRNDDAFDKVMSVLENYSGELGVKIKIESKTLQLSRNVRQCKGIIYELEEILGKGNALFYTKSV